MLTFKKGGAFKLLQLLLVKSAQNPEKIIVQSPAGDTRKRPKAESPIPDSQLALLNTGAGGPPPAGAGGPPPAAGAPGVAAPVAAGAAGDTNVLFCRLPANQATENVGTIGFIRDKGKALASKVPFSGTLGPALNKAANGTWYGVKQLGTRAGSKDTDKGLF